MFNMTISSNIKLPKFNFSEDLKHIADRIFIVLMQNNINNQISIEGDSLPRNEPRTLKNKDKLGQGDRSLIATRDLIESFYSESIGKNTIIVTLRENRKDIGSYLQFDGIRTKANGTKYYKFFGINKQMENNAIAYMKARINQIINESK